MFVANPNLAGSADGFLTARPDDVSDTGLTWRQVLEAYNERPGNPLNLLMAYRLYTRPAYGDLVNAFGAGNVYILSAGWGLIPATYLTPYYDITFSTSAPPEKHRRSTDRYDDFRLLAASDRPLVFLGGRSYLDLFCRLTDQHQGRRIVLYNSAKRPTVNGVELVRFDTPMRTNWHYGAAAALTDGRISFG